MADPRGRLIVVGPASYVYYKRQPRSTRRRRRSTSARPAKNLPGEKASDQEGQDSRQPGGGDQLDRRRRGAQRACASDSTQARSRQGQGQGEGAEKSQFITITAEGAHRAGRGAAREHRGAGVHQAPERQPPRAIGRAIAIDARQLSGSKTASAATSRAAASAKGGKDAATDGAEHLEHHPGGESQQQDQPARIELAPCGAQQVKIGEAGDRVLLSPKPRKNAIFGFVIGLVLASIAAYVLSRFDRRLRSLAEHRGGVRRAEVLTALPKVRRPIVRRDGLPAPSRVLLEPLRRLHIALRLERPRRRQQASPRSILVREPRARRRQVDDRRRSSRSSSAMPASAWRSSRRTSGGRCRRRLLGLDGPPRARRRAQRARSRSSEAMQRVLPSTRRLRSRAAPRQRRGRDRRRAARAGALSGCSRGGGPVPNPPALLAQPAMARAARARPPRTSTPSSSTRPSPLQVSDVMPLLGVVDGDRDRGARSGTRVRASARRLVQLLAHTPSAPVLGVAANGVARAEIREVRLLGAQRATTWPGTLVGR